MKTEFPSKSEIVRSWYVLDATETSLGRVATKAAKVLMGKHKPSYTPFLDTGDHVIVINAEKAVLTGTKEQQKMYRRHSGYPGGLTETPRWQDAPDPAHPHRRGSQSRACCPRPSSASRCTASSRSTPAINTPTRLSSPRLCPLPPGK